MKFLKNITGGDASTRNKGAISLEYILVIVVVVLACLVGMKAFGGKIAETINNSKDAVVNTTDNVFNQLGGTASGGGSGSGESGSGTGGSGGGSSDPSDHLHRHGSDLANGWCSDEGEDDYYEDGVSIVFKDSSKYFMSIDNSLANGTYGGRTFVDGVEQVTNINITINGRPYTIPNEESYSYNQFASEHSEEGYRVQRTNYRDGTWEEALLIDEEAIRFTIPAGDTYVIGSYHSFYEAYNTYGITAFDHSSNTVNIEVDDTIETVRFYTWQTVIKNTNFSIDASNNILYKGSQMYYYDPNGVKTNVTTASKQINMLYNGAYMQFDSSGYETGFWTNDKELLTISINGVEYSRPKWTNLLSLANESDSDELTCSGKTSPFEYNGTQLKLNYPNSSWTNTIGRDTFKQLHKYANEKGLSTVNLTTD